MKDLNQQTSGFHQQRWGLKSHHLPICDSIHRVPICDSIHLYMHFLCKEMGFKHQNHPKPLFLGHIMAVPWSINEMVNPPVITIFIGHSQSWVVYYHFFTNIKIYMRFPPSTLKGVGGIGALAHLYYHHQQRLQIVKSWRKPMAKASAPVANTCLRIPNLTSLAWQAVEQLWKMGIKSKCKQIKWQTSPYVAQKCGWNLKSYDVFHPFYVHLRIAREC